MLDDRAGGDLELADGQAAGVQIEQVVEGQFAAAELGDHREHVGAGAHLRVVGGALVGVLAVGQLEHLLERAHHQCREVGALLLEPAGDGGVVARGVGEGLGGERLAGGGREPAVELAQLGQDGVVALGADHRRDELEVLGGGADHRRPADVDVLDHLGVGHAPARRGALERIQVHAHQVDELDVVLLGLAHVGVVVAEREQPAVQLRMERLDPPVHDLRKAGQVGDLEHLEAGAGQLAGGAAGRDDLDPQVG